MALTAAAHGYNFCSGPSALPAAVMQRAQAEFTDYRHCGSSIIEMSHRSEAFLAVLAAAAARLRDLLAVPGDYRILFMHGGASLQFSALALNLLAPGGKAGYLDTGYWSQKAYLEAQQFGRVELIGSAARYDYKRGLAATDYQIDGDLAYVHYTPNETIDGLAFDHIPETGPVPLVADMSSCILSEPIDVRRFGLIYAGAQKNIGPAGLAVVIVRADLLGQAQVQTPRLLNYGIVAAERSLANTPPTFAIYLANLVFRWLGEQGGLGVVAERNRTKAAMLYKALDASQLFYNDVAPAHRSTMNVPFFLRDAASRGVSLQDNAALAAAFSAAADRAGLLNLTGHRSRGGFRASLYNAMPTAGVQALVEFLHLFENDYDRY
ncbi:3-phosphoserine/phosphohydroxythreonine transaminase [Reinekea sp.]|jgi:phosphoserine aminotransferase|uniref:3-phosphoserine/phosphohydroxythreonine transaminase n=1 Tax=Reinekea sp. TaxID=1970455 RepID=UPI002A829CA6|nr:3-phosphoserine/phosphohydroxythreonine transaminase [Reinekea sp.]